MQLKSSWSRGLLYGGICAGVVVVAVVVLAIIGGKFGQSVLGACVAGGIGWGGIGFLLGFFSHREPSLDPAGEPVPISRTATVKRWVYRLIAGLCLGHLGAMIVEVLMLGLVVMIYGGLDEFLKSKPTPESIRFHFLGLFIMIGSAMASMLGGFLGVMLAPLRFSSPSIIRSSLMAAALGGLAGAWFGGSLGLLYPQYLESDHCAVLSVVGGALSGIAAAIFLRVRVIDEGSS